MRHVTSRPPSNKDCTIKGKQLYNVLRDMEGCPSLVNMQCLPVCAIILQFETLLSASANYAPLSAAVAQVSTFQCHRHGEYSVSHTHTHTQDGLCFSTSTSIPESVTVKLFHIIGEVFNRGRWEMFSRNACIMIS